MLPPLPSLLVQNAPKWAQGMSMWADYQAARGSGLLFPPGVDTHAATIYAPSSAGVYQSFGANVPVLTDLGLQTVPTRTNSIRNNSMVGAVPGSPGTAPTNWSGFGTASGITVAVAAVGTEDGLPYIDLDVSGTASATVSRNIGMEGTSVIAATSGQTWAQSIFAKIVSGSAANFLGINLNCGEYTAGGAYLGESGCSLLSLASVTGANTRFTKAGATVAGTVAFLGPYIAFVVNNGATVALRLRIYAPQLELGAFSSPPILTTTVAVTVTGNLQVLSGLGTQLASGVAGIWQGVINQPAVSGSNYQIVNFNDNTGNNRLNLYLLGGGGLTIGMDTSGVGQGTVSFNGFSQASLTTIAFIWTGNFFTARAVGQSAPTADTVSTYPTGLDRLTIGHRPSVTDMIYQNTRKLALDFTGPFDQTKFDAIFARAQIASSA